MCVKNTCVNLLVKSIISFKLLSEATKQSKTKIYKFSSVDLDKQKTKPCKFKHKLNLTEEKSFGVQLILLGYSSFLGASKTKMYTLYSL